MILLTLMVGVVQTGISLLRLGDLTRYVSHAVIVGFTVGAAVLLVLDQLKNLLGLTAGGTGEDHFLKRFWLTMSHIEQTNRTALFVGLATIAIALVLHGSMPDFGSACRSCCWRHLRDGHRLALGSSMNKA